MSEKMIVACPECATRFVAPLEKFLPKGRKVRCAKCGHAWFQTVAVADTPDAPTPAQPQAPAAKPSSDSIIDRATEAHSANVIERADQRRAELETSTVDSGNAAIAAGTVAAGAAANAALGVGTADADADYGDTATMPDSAAVPEPKARRGFLRRTLFYGVCAAIIAGAAGYFFKDPISAKVPSLEPTLTKWHGTVDGVVSKVFPEKRTLSIESVKYDFEEIDGGKALLVSAEVLNTGKEMQDAPKLLVRVLDASKAVLHEATIAPKDLSEDIKPQDRAPYFMRLPLPPEGLESVDVNFAE